MAEYNFTPFNSQELDAVTAQKQAGLWVICDFQMHMNSDLLV